MLPPNGKAAKYVVKIIDHYESYKQEKESILKMKQLFWQDCKACNDGLDIDPPFTKVKAYGQFYLEKRDTSGFSEKVEAMLHSPTKSLGD